MTTNEQVASSATDEQVASSATDLAIKKCVSCAGGVAALTAEEIPPLLDELGGGWKLIENHHIEKEYKFKNFRAAVNFASAVADVADAQNHHPDLYVAWGKVRITLCTHKIDGLTENDFILAAKIDEGLAKPACRV